MTSIKCMTIALLIALLLGACGKANPQADEAMINPGDKIGDFLITTGVKGEVVYVFDWGRSCTEQDDKDSYVCEYPAGRKVNITSTGLYDDTVRSETPTERLIEEWSNFNYELYVNGRRVNLEAFGTIETIHPVVGVIRFWNVVLVTEKAGEITIQDSGMLDDKPFGQTGKWTFTEP